MESNVEVVPLGVKPGAQAKSDKVPINRSGGKEKGPQVYPSSFGGNSEPVQPLETNNNDHFLGPRGLKFNKREAGDEILERSRRGLNDELGVLSGYQVISEVDLAFKPSFEDGVGVTTFQGKILPEEIVYGVCLPATGFSVLFVLLSLLTVSCRKPHLDLVIGNGLLFVRSSTIFSCNKVFSSVLQCSLDVLTYDKANYWFNLRARHRMLMHFQ